MTLSLDLSSILAGQPASAAPVHVALQAVQDAINALQFAPTFGVKIGAAGGLNASTETDITGTDFTVAPTTNAKLLVIGFLPLQCQGVVPGYQRGQAQIRDNANNVVAAGADVGFTTTLVTAETREVRTVATVMGLLSLAPGSYTYKMSCLGVTGGGLGSPTLNCEVSQLLYMLFAA